MLIDSPKLSVKSALTTAAFLVLCAVPAFSQNSVCPAGLICLTQAEANAAAQNARENPALKEKIAVLEAALAAKDKNVADVQEAARRNEADLRAAMQKTEVELARLSGQLTKAEAMNVTLTEIIKAMTPLLRRKSVGVINF
jgi:septal ring factor EnvC (AmiA/AmiB activator)